MIRIAHELRTPLSATLLWARLLNNPGPADPDLLREGLAAIESSAKEQKSLIDQLVEVANLLAGRIQLHPTPVALPAFTRRIIDPLQTVARSRKIELHLSMDPAAGTIPADAPRLQQILHILLGNALEFTPAGGRVDLKLSRGKNFVVWRVTDTGSGIGAKSLPHLFKLNAKEKPPGSRTPTGLGVGLFIADRLVALHHGTLSVKSGGTDQGSAFTVHLPCPARASVRPRAKVAG